MIIDIDVTDKQAWAFAQVLKRIGFSEYRHLSRDDAEAYAALSASEAVREALAKNGYNPR